jgi:hypothetical protein
MVEEEETPHAARHEILNEVLDYLGQASVMPNVSRKTKEMLAYVAYRVSSGGLPPFPSQVKEVLTKLEVRGHAANDRVARAIEASLRKGGE